MTQNFARLRMRLVAAILLAVALAALGVGIFIIDWIGEAAIEARQRDVAASARDYFVSFALEEGLTPLANALDRRERVGAHEAFHYSLFNGDGDVVGGAHLLRGDQLPAPGVTRMDIAVDGAASPWEVLVQPISVGGTLVVYEDLSERENFRQALLAGAFVSLLAAIGAVLAASLWLSRLLYRRAETIAATAGQIAGGKVSARAPVHPDGDVFDRLAIALNAMLDRNEELLTGLRTVTDSLAHDLRSPLTRMKGALSRALAPGAEESVRTEAIEQAWAEADRALSTTSALLDIARAETGLSRDMFQPVDIGRLVVEIAELFGPVIEDAGQSLRVSSVKGTLLVEAHELLLRQALGNLLHNAALYAGPGARVEVAIETTPQCVRLIVADTGPGIPESERGRVRERFVRLDAARTAPGSGLGLAIAAACATLHRGSLRLEDNHPGLRAVLEIARA